MKRNFCGICEKEFIYNFYQEFNTWPPAFTDAVISKNALTGKKIKSFACYRNYLDNDGKVKTCLIRLYETLHRYILKFSVHREQLCSMNNGNKEEMSFNQYQYKVYHSKDWNEAENLALEFFNCDITHKKINTTLYRRIIKAPLGTLEKKDFKNITCYNCKSNKYKFD